ncbi:uncharacterized protein BJ171DRAFT_640844 [Polychytrium aggregatum]|uniref:uncharacterized protein n=1 Tax=Polychytrium aggregatum TaxID=110093 RepID=UPI0022FDD2FF|nr:uncharacterized protein BJ171DRAFT_640844 [Polychytrium aggregatum]KAI9193187.1 hypothetical protein BJ171DRAFT_640844 [Polychytrium aggregatum]
MADNVVWNSGSTVVTDDAMIAHSARRRFDGFDTLLTHFATTAIPQHHNTTTPQHHNTATPQHHSHSSIGGPITSAADNSDSIPTSIRLHFGTTLINLLFTLPTIILDYYAAQSLGNPLLITLTRYLLVYFPIVLVVPSALLSLTSIRKSVQAVQTVIATIHICNIGGCLVRHGLVLVSGESGLTLFATSLSQLIFSTFVASTSGISAETSIPMILLSATAYIFLAAFLSPSHALTVHGIQAEALAALTTVITAGIVEHGQRRLFLIRRCADIISKYATQQSVVDHDELSSVSPMSSQVLSSNSDPIPTSKSFKSSSSKSSARYSRSISATQSLGSKVAPQRQFPQLVVVNASSILLESPSSSQISFQPSLGIADTLTRDDVYSTEEIARTSATSNQDQSSPQQSPDLGLPTAPCL